MCMRMKKYNCLRFTSLEEEKLIDLVQKYPALHCVTNRTYKKLEVKENIWKMVAKEVGRSVKDCKVRWKSIKDYFQRKKKSSAGGSQGGDVYPDEKFQRLHFLEEFYPDGKAKINVSSRDSPELVLNDESVDIDSDDKNDESEINDDDQIKRKRPELRSIAVEKRKIRSKGRKTILRRDPKNVPRMEGRIGERLSSLRDLRDDNLTTDVKPVKCASGCNEDETDLFFKAMCATAKNLPPHFLRESKKKIFDMMFDLETRAAYEPAASYTSYIQNPSHIVAGALASPSSGAASGMFISSESDTQEATNI